MTTFLQQLMLSIHTGRQKNLLKIAVYFQCRPFATPSHWARIYQAIAKKAFFIYQCGFKSGKRGQVNHEKTGKNFNHQK
ncbi:hypothetical protein CE143_07730 [Photorhabdus luminescens]|uniref:Uncharacterized protein n=1 Tax=Photorhabdus akhurstii TaxID=171438 RepID=A0ABX8LRZ5_9GAMM|nr:hypothetical protein B0X70_07810 [Photorhabdus akhurstii]UJD74838.1 hypothetical protein CE143_07730 [Photorhabdus luminescens]